MIIDDIREASRYASLHPLFPLAFDVLSRRDLASLTPGKHQLDGDRLSMVIAVEEGKGMDGAVLESHRRFIDIQFVAGGTDLIGWRSLAECADVRRRYDEHDDVALYGERPAAWNRVTGGTFAVYFPGDAHAPLGGTGKLHRVILKVRI